MALTYGQMAAVNRARKNEERRANTTDKKKTKSKSIPKIDWFPMTFYVSTGKFKDIIQWDDNSEYSDEFAKRLIDKPNLQILTMPTGFGKTSVAVSTLGKLGRPFCIIASKAIIEGGGWQETISDYNRVHPGANLAPHMMTTYDKFSNILGNVKSRADFKKGFPKDGILVLDEVHNYKTPTSKRSQKLKNIPDYERMGISATPLTNDIVMDMCSYMVMAGRYRSKTFFEQCYGLDVMKDRYYRLTIYDDDGSVNTRKFPDYDKLLDEVAEVIYQPNVSISDIDMPNLTTTVLQLPVSKQLLADMRSIADAYAKQMFASASEMRLVMQERIANDDGRIVKLREIVCGENVKQPLIFFQHLTTLDAIRNMLDAEGISYQILDGRHSMKDIDRDNLSPILIQYQSGREGIEFKNSNTTVFYENQPSYMTLVQCAGRNARRGMKGVEINHYHLVSMNEYDQEVFSRVQSKVEINPRTLDELALKSLPTNNNW